MSLFEILQVRRARVLFVCFGNSCRSQMADGFARAYGSDVLESHSAGIHPASRISRRASAVMEEKSISLADSCPKNISTLRLDDFDLIVNLTEYSLPDTSALVIRRVLPDPITGDKDAFRDVRDDIEQLVCFLIVHFHVARQWYASANPLYSEECSAAV